MRTKPVDPSPDALQRFNDAMRRPHTWGVTGIEAFWLENAVGDALTEDFPDTGPAYEAVLTAMERGAGIEDLVLVGRRSHGGRAVLTRGLILLDLAEAHAGIPARKRIPVE